MQQDSAEFLSVLLNLCGSELLRLIHASLVKQMEELARLRTVVARAIAAHLMAPPAQYRALIARALDGTGVEGRGPLSPSPPPPWFSWPPWSCRSICSPRWSGSCAHWLVNLVHDMFNMFCKKVSLDS
ncbi:unnamed protein product [Microthlaspi erraticum]|uniref:Uncharacterized protein n=1 Tax=Microthlaspi erraticum TaxID=1685480 RepID=A0A6D2J9X8_9BRAS|nr:unnamed protein product [Microthlaspi erraticum]